MVGMVSAISAEVYHNTTGRTSMGPKIKSKNCYIFITLVVNGKDLELQRK